MIFHRHKWMVVAFDPGYTMNFDEDRYKTHYHLTFSKCRCGERRMAVQNTPKDSIGFKLTLDQHKGATKAKMRWEHSGILHLSDQADVYDPDYIMLGHPQQRIRKWTYKPITESGKILKMLEECDEFKELRKHQMIDDAFGELKTVIQMHENIEVPE